MQSIGRQVSVGLSYNHYILSSLQKQNSNKKSYHNGLQKQKKILSQIKFWQIQTFIQFTF